MIMSSYGSVNHVLWECPAYSSLNKLVYRGCLGVNLSTSSHLVVSRRRPLCWVVSCGRINAILHLTELAIY